MTEKEIKTTCSKCKQKKDHSEFYDGIECFACWELGVNRKRIQELREQLSQYLDIDKVKIKENLTLGQLEKVRKIINDNYVVGSDTKGGVASEKGGKELIMALWMTGSKAGWQPSKCLAAIDLEIEKLKPILPEPQPEPELKTYVRNCPTCNEKFSCELEESDTSEKEANDILSKQVDEHVKEVHEEGKKKKRERERESNLPDPNEEKKDNASQPQTNNQFSPKSNENKILLPLIIIGSLILVSVLLVFLYLARRKKG